MEIFKNWVNTIVGMSILLIIIELILPKTTLKKYVNTLVGMFFILVILNPVISFIKNDSIEETVLDVVSNFDEYYKSENDSSLNKDGNENVQNSLIKLNMKDSIKEDIKKSFKDEATYINDIKVNIDDDFNIKNIEVDLKSSTKDEDMININKYVKEIIDKYEINSSNVVLNKEGV